MLERGLALLDTKDSPSICEGAKILAKLGAAEGIDPLLGLIRSRDEAARECVRQALDQLDVAPVLLARWRGEDGDQRRLALEHAVALSHPGLMDLYEEAAKHSDAFIRRRAATGLRRQAEGTRSLALLETLLADGDADVRWWAIDTLSLSKSEAAKRLLRARFDEEQDANLRALIDKALQ